MMLSFIQYFTEQTSPNYDIQQWSIKLNRMLKRLQQLQTQRYYNDDITNEEAEAYTKQINKMFKQIDQYVNTMSSRAYTKLYRFHELEYKLHLLKQKYHDTKLIEFTEYELNALYDWIKIFLVSILDTRVIIEPGPEEQYTDFVHRIQNRDFESINNITDDVKGQSWTSIEAGYYLIKHAVSLPEKIKAVSITLNACHDHGRLFGGKFDDETEDTYIRYWFAPFTLEQYEKLSNINPQRVEREILRELQ